MHALFTYAHESRPFLLKLKYLVYAAGDTLAGTTALQKIHL